MADTKSMGFMKPIGGGDPVPLRKPEIVVGRRASCDIRLDFENVSGRHCALTYHGGTWHIRDLGSTNGTKVNGAKVERQQGLMPDDEIAIASHLFTLDYEPSGAIAESQQVLEEETGHAKRTSLMELAGIEGEDRARPPRPRLGPSLPRLPRDPSRRTRAGRRASRSISARTRTSSGRRCRCRTRTSFSV